MTAPTEKLHWRDTMEAMFVLAFPVEKYPGLKERYAELGFDVGRPLLPAYSEQVFQAALAAQRAFVFSGLPDGAASFRQGGRFVETYFERTVLGGALQLLLRALGPRRTLERMARNLRTGNNFCDANFTADGPNSGRLRVSEVFDTNPEWARGIIKRGMELAGATVDLTVEAVALPSATYRITWR